MTSQNETIETWTLSNASGMRIKIIAYGGIITELHVPDRNDHFDDVVLGFKTPSDYLKKHPFFGTITGRVAGRLTAGKFTLEGQSYELALTDAPNHIHGGKVGLDKRIWTLKSKMEQGDRLSSITLEYQSPDGEEGYPGNLNISVRYSLNEDNALIIGYEATTDKATPLSLTNHSYFNLSGEGSGTIQEHRLQIMADTYIPTDDNMTLQGYAKSVDGMPNDFRQPQLLKERIPHLHKQHGDDYLIRESKDTQTVHVAQLQDPKSGRVMDVFTTEPHLQFYTGRFLDGSLIGKSGKAYGPHAGLCLECQNYPDGVNTPELGNIILRANETYHQKTIYQFSTD